MTIQPLINILHGMTPLMKRVLVVCVDIVLIPLSLWIALSLRYGEWFADFDKIILPIFGLLFFSIPVFVKLGLYRAVIRYFGLNAMSQIVNAAVFSGGVMFMILLVTPNHGLPRSIFIIYALVLMMLLIGSRWWARRILGGPWSENEGIPVAIYGAGESGKELASILIHGLRYKPVLFLDDAEELQGREVDGLPVVDPTTSQLNSIIVKNGIQEIFISIATASRQQIREILERLEPLPCHIRKVPALDKVLSGEAQLDQLQEIQIDDLLGRNVVEPKTALLGKNVTGKTVMITGAGGSIGAELCRQILKLSPERMLILDVSEYSLYRIDHELRKLDEVLKQDVEIITLLGSVTDKQRIERVFYSYKIDSVYHAAAYKHVPLVEHNILEGVGNNAIGTFILADIAAQAGITNFLLISTDKAVRPTNVMGASKRMAEMFLQAFQERYPDTTFSMVRFGNVLGSSGSVVPLFRRQIEEGGPVTVTHPEITRYFMTIPEAVQLVIQAGAMAKGGDVFVLDMGESVRIVDLARKMVRLSGLEVKDVENPAGDIEIVFTGLRPGEKLYEELLIGDNVQGTDHPMIMKAEETYIEWGELSEILAKMEAAIAKGDPEVLRDLLLKSLEGYKPQGDIADWLWLAKKQKPTETSIH
jgi:FlaA1/EpsC-like NDP-sugar epimerase